MIQIDALKQIRNQRRYLKSISTDWNKILELEQQYSHYDAMVFGTPKYNIDNIDLFLDYWEQHSIPCVRQKNDIASPYLIDDQPRFKTIDIYDRFPDMDRIWTKNYKDMKSIIPTLYEQLLDTLPFDNINYIRLWQSIRPIKYHHDDSVYYLNMPTELRIMLYDENDNATLKLVSETQPNKSKYIKLPPEHNFFAWNNVRMMHGSDRIEGRKKILACITGDFNFNKLERLYEARIEEYCHITPNDPYSKLVNIEND